MIRPPPRSTLFPYTTLSRFVVHDHVHVVLDDHDRLALPLQPVDVIEQVLEQGSDRKSTRLNSSHGYISYAVFCLKKKNNTTHHQTATPSIWPRAPDRTTQQR